MKSREKTLAELFNENYINIIENSSGIKLNSEGDSSTPTRDKYNLKEIIQKYKTHSSVLNIKNNCPNIENSY